MPTGLERRITVLEDIEKLKKLKASYCYLADAGMKDASVMETFGDLFTEDIWVDFEFLGSYHDKDAVVSFYRDQVASLLSYSAHTVTNPRIEIDGNSGIGEWYVLVPLTVRKTGQAAWLQACYVEEYRKIGSDWKWSSITARFEHITPFKQGWDEVPIMDDFLPPGHSSACQTARGK